MVTAIPQCFGSDQRSPYQARTSNVLHHNISRRCSYIIGTVKVSKLSGNITVFEGDGIVVPCDVDLTYRKTNDVVRDINTKAGNKLWEELANIGYCEIGHAVITQAYGLPVKKLIFLPYIDRDNSQRIDFILFHQAVRSALSLASLYGLKTLAIPVLPNILPNSKNEHEVEDIIEGITKTFVSPSLKELSLFF